MRIEKRVIYGEIILSLCGMVGFLVVNNTSIVMAHVAMLLMICFVAMSLVGFDLMHPYVWFSGFFGLYSIGYPLLYVKGYTKRIIYSKNALLLEMLALVVMLLVITPKKNKKLQDVELNRCSINLGVLNKVIYIVLVGLIMLGGLLVIKNGFSGKEDIYNSGNILLNMIFKMPLILSLFYTISIITIYGRTGKFQTKQMLITMCALLFLTLFSGERDFIFRFVILNVFILWYLKKIEIKHIVILIPIALAGFILSSSYKYYFLTGNMSVSGGDFWYSVLSGEFESASRNLQEVVNHSVWTLGIKGYRQIFFDIIGVFYSGIESTTAWYNNVFYKNSTTQYGFSLVGEGYVIGGALGVVCLFVLVGLIIKWFYKNANRSNYMLAAYMYFTTIVIYSIRADFSTILSGIVKQICIVLLILYIAEKVGRMNS